MHPEESAEKLTTHCKGVIVRAAALAGKTHADAIRPAHLFLGLLEEKGAVGRAIFLGSSALPPARVRQWMKASLQSIASPETPTEPKKTATLLLAPETQDLIVHAMKSARDHHHAYVGTEHLLAVFVREQSDILHEMGISPKKLRHLDDAIAGILESATHFSEHDAHGHLPLHHQTKTRTRTKKNSAVNLFCRDLTTEAREGRLDPIIGREQEIQRTIVVLARRNKNNPMLLGESGVGKTAIVEGIAARIASGAVPAHLRNTRIMALDLGALVAGTVWRGEFEGRLKQLVDDIEQSRDVILFIDELHTIMGAGAASGALDCANLLKPALARGTLRCIGATTVQDYKKTIETDPALERRFHPIAVAEPSKDDTIAILQGLKKKYEDHHGVVIADDGIRAAVTLAKRYFPTAMLPDKAIDLLDEASAGVSMRIPDDPRAEQEQTLRARLKVIDEKRDAAVDANAFTEAVTLAEEELRLTEALAALMREKKPDVERPVVDHAAVAAMVAAIVHVPTATVERVGMEKTACDRMLREHILGQDRAMTTITHALERAYAEFSPRERPRASFLLIGPSGVGKTETAKTIARALFPNETAFVRIDMGELAQGFHTAKLIGAPPGYVGYREGAALTDAIKNNPSQVVLFDEIEKAHPEALHLILGLLDEGMLTDATGKRISFRETIVICTSNIGTREQSSDHQMGFAPSAAISEGSLRALAARTLPLEFLNRLDAFIAFTPLAPETIRALVDRHLAQYTTTLAARGTTLLIHAAVPERLTELAYRPDEGARAVRRVIQEHVEDALVRASAGTGKPGNTLTLNVDKGNIILI